MRSRWASFSRCIARMEMVEGGQLRLGAGQLARQLAGGTFVLDSGRSALSAAPGPARAAATSRCA